MAGADTNAITSVSAALHKDDKPIASWPSIISMAWQCVVQIDCCIELLQGSPPDSNSNRVSIV